VVVTATATLAPFHRNMLLTSTADLFSADRQLSAADVKWAQAIASTSWPSLPPIFHREQVFRYFP